MGDLTSLVKAVAINSMFEDREGNLWLATRGMGLIRWRNGALVRVPTSQNNILAVAEDREGNIWAGTSGGGLNRLRLRGFYMHKADEGLYNDHVVSVCEDTEGKLWLAPTPYPPVRATDAGNRSFTTPPGWGIAAIKGNVTALCADPAGGVWIACSNGRLLHWRDGAYAVTPPHVAAVGLLVDRQGDLWVAAARGALIRLRDESVVLYLRDTASCLTRGHWRRTPRGGFGWGMKGAWSFKAGMIGLAVCRCRGQSRASLFVSSPLMKMTPFG